MKTSAIITFLVCSTALAQSAAPSWDQVTSEKKKSCTKALPCYVKDKKSDVQFKVIFHTATEEDVTLIKEIEIKNMKNDKVSKFSPEDVAGVLDGESFQLFSPDVNDDGAMDLALFASSSARGGPMFYYFIQDPKKGQFVMTKDTIPELGKPKGGKLLSQSTDDAYVIGKDFQIKVK